MSDAVVPSSATLEELLPAVLPVAYRVALSMARDPHDAEDLVQEAALNACRGFDGFEPGTNFKAWFLRILTNAFISRHRRRARQGAPISLDEMEAPDALLLAAGPGGPDEADALTALIGRIDTEEILAALGQLPVEYRTVAVLYFVEDLSYQDIAHVVGCPVGTVRSRLHRSRHHLKQALASLAADWGLLAEPAFSEAAA